ncbi:MAG: M48 family metallopeptidase [Bacteroidales bacterium]
MKKLIFQLAVMLLIMAAIWAFFTQIDFVKILRPQQKLEQGEKKLGELLLNVYKMQSERIDDPLNDAYLNSILEPLFDANDIDPQSISIYILRSDAVNAFALPGRNVVLLSGLIDFVDGPEELIAIIAHEIAHLEADHVMRKLRREIGITALLSLVSGNYNLDLMREIASLIATNSYSRVLENEADKLALDYMYAAEIDPMALVKVFMLFAESFGSVPQQLQWISTHPQSVDRADRLEMLLAAKPSKSYRTFDRQEWKQFKTRLQAFNP